MENVSVRVMICNEKKMGDLQIAQILPTALHFDPNN